MYNIQFMSQTKFKELMSLATPKSLSKTLAISIVTTSVDSFEISNKFANSLQLIFKDDNESFTESHANQILASVSANKDTIDTIYVHCLMGVSRSAAVALFLTEAFNEITIEDIRRSPYCNYNRHVYTTLFRVFYDNEI